MTRTCRTRVRAAWLLRRGYRMVRKTCSVLVTTHAIPRTHAGQVSGHLKTDKDTAAIMQIAGPAAAAFTAPLLDVHCRVSAVAFDLNLSYCNPILTWPAMRHRQWRTTSLPEARLWMKSTRQKKATRSAQHCTMMRTSSWQKMATPSLSRNQATTPMTRSTGRGRRSSPFCSR